jgi:3-hydroxy-9,10-secoandrosta-1,3,5(10)-triene-9,17-dione monooxygenase reductase component
MIPDTGAVSLSGSFTQRDLRDAFGAFGTGVTVVTAVRPDGEPVGVTANSFSSVSLDPPLLLWCLANASASVAAFGPGAAFAVHILCHEQRDLALHFARRAREKFEVDRHWRASPYPPRIAGALCRFDCRVYAVYPGGDHAIVVGEVLEIVRGTGSPLTFHGGRFGTFTPDSGVGRVDVWESWQDHWF